MDNGLKVKNNKKVHKTVVLYGSMGTYVNWLLSSVGTSNRDVILGDE
jgi:hypothetical protein